MIKFIEEFMGRARIEIDIEEAKRLVLETDLTMGEIAARFGMPSSLFIKRFKAEFGITPLKYRRKHVPTSSLNKWVGVKKDLRETHWMLDVIAAHRGFSSGHSLSTLFARVMDQSCGEYRKQAWLEHGAPSKGESRVERGIRIAQDFLRETRWPVFKVAARSGFTLTAFFRQFKEGTGESPKAFRAREFKRLGKSLLSSRMLKAKKMLEETDLSVVEVSELCGYKSYNSLSVHFTNAVGLSPQKYRHSLGKTMCVKRDAEIPLYVSQIKGAKDLMVETELSLNAIAKEMGYRQRSQFFATFKKHEGCTPGQYREQWRRAVLGGISAAMVESKLAAPVVRSYE